MGAAREMYADELAIQRIHGQLPNLMTIIWANHSHTSEGMFTEEILESIQSLQEQLESLKVKVKEGTR